VRVVQPELVRLGVHLADERPLVAARCDRQRERVVVPRVEEHRRKELPRLDTLAGPKPLADERNARHRRVDGDDVVRLQLPEGEQRSHDLRRRGHLAALVRPARPEHPAGLPVDEHRRRAGQRRRELVAKQGAAEEQPLRRRDDRGHRGERGSRSPQRSMRMHGDERDVRGNGIRQLVRADPRAAEACEDHEKRDGGQTAEAIPVTLSAYGRHGTILRRGAAISSSLQ
jgi:hypothetical protein